MSKKNTKRLGNFSLRYFFLKISLVEVEVYWTDYYVFVIVRCGGKGVEVEEYEWFCVLVGAEIWVHALVQWDCLGIFEN